MIIRRYQKHEIPAMIELHKEGLGHFHYKNIHYSKNKVEDLLVGNLRNPEFFCHLMVEDDGSLSGVLGADLVEYVFSHEAFAQMKIMYIRKGHSHSKGATGLVAAYTQWAIKMGAREIIMSQSTGDRMPAFVRLMKRYGFNQIGTTLLMEVNK